MTNSRLPGFYKLSMDERRSLTSQSSDIDRYLLDEALDHGLSAQAAQNMTENVIGRYALPFSLGLNFHINGKDFLAPMVVEEPSVIAASSNAAKIIRAGGGFQASADEPLMIAQVQLLEVTNPLLATQAIEAQKAALLRQGNEAVPGLVNRGGGCTDLEVRDLGDGMLVVHIIVDCRNAMGANLVNTVAEALATRLAQLSRGRVGLRILSNLADRRCVHVSCKIPPHALKNEDWSAEQVRDGIIDASKFAEKDPYRAATHNKGIMNGLDAVIMATGNDWRSVEAGAHAYAARNGQYAPLCTWSKDTHGNLCAAMTLPLALGTVGGPTRIHPGAKLALRISQVKDSQELAMLAASVGMASNLAALKALATTGIQKGHMALHARSVAAAAGAIDSEIEAVAGTIHAAGNVTLNAAREALNELREQELETASLRG
ncbi:MAG: hydroxymethylglutaryl-CoA reductase, degradative [Myxococcales bacterium]|nr:MAG: hydroxymethylglutaryl-CoA reductase, degradative [Myxococcales bacterium]